MKLPRFLLLIPALALSACSILPDQVTKESTTPFSIVLKNSGVKLALSTTRDFAKSKESLSIPDDNMLPFQEYTYSALPSPEILDNEDTPYDYGCSRGPSNKKEAFYYFKYTFYVKNIGDVTARYIFTINLEENKSEAGKSLNDTLRVMVFNNDATNPNMSVTHDYSVYAKEAAGNNYDRDGNPTNREFIAYNSIGGYEDEQHLLAFSFQSDSIAFRHTHENMVKNDITRYTIVFWLEGEDPQSSADAEAPTGSSINMKIDIVATESN